MILKNYLIFWLYLHCNVYYSYSQSLSLYFHYIILKINETMSNYTESLLINLVKITWKLQSIYQLNYCLLFIVDKELKKQYYQ